jgi:lysophospholipase L1-like esterase
MLAAAIALARPIAKNISETVEQSLRALPRPLRVRSVWVTTYHSPYYTTHFTAEERLIYTRNVSAMGGVLRRAGYTSLVVGSDWNVADFADGVHLSEQGGRKLAEAVAPLLVQKARAL